MKKVSGPQVVRPLEASELRLHAGFSRRSVRVEVGEDVEQAASATRKSSVSEILIERRSHARRFARDLDGGVKLPLGLWEGSTENATLACMLLANVVDRGLDPEPAILFGKKFIEVSLDHWDWQGDRLHAPGCYPVRAVPSGGCPGILEVEKFGNQYFTLLTNLGNAWSGGGQASLDTAVNDMFALEATAETIVVKHIPWSNPAANYGPDFTPRPRTGDPSQGRRRLPAT